MWQNAATGFSRYGVVTTRMKNELTWMSRLGQDDPRGRNMPKEEHGRTRKRWVKETKEGK
jgi:hypothetical protein